MNDPVTTTVGVGLGILGSKDLLNKILGPTADYIGGEAKNLVQRCNINLENVFAIALRRLGKQADIDGSVSPRVLKRFLDEARFCEDPLVAEYLGGVLASSKETAPRDDRAVTYLNILGNLSTYQVRTHYLLYTAFFSLAEVLEQDNRFWFDRDLFTIYISDNAYATAMDFDTGEKRENITRHAFLGLERQRLSEGGMDVIQEHKERNLTEPFRYFYPTRYGIELFLWGLGLGNAEISPLLKTEIDSKLIPNFGLSPLLFDTNRVGY